MKTAVIGGGVLGATVANKLRKAGHEVTLFEAAPELGGLASAWELGDVRWDRHYHVTLLSDAHTRAMYAELGLDDQINWVETRTGYFGTDRQLRSVSNPVEFLKLPGLRLLDKLRLGSTIVYGSRISNGHRMEQVTVETWLRRWSGGRAFEVFWKPLLRAKLGDLYTRTSAAFIWSTIRRLYAARRSGLDKEMFGYITGGYAVVFDRYQAALEGAGVEVRLASRVSSVGRSDTPNQLSVRTDGSDSAETFDRVVVTSAAPIAAQLCHDLLPAERRRLESVDYVGIVCVSLLLDRPLADYYLTYITDPATPFTAVVEMTAFVDPAEVGGHALVYLPKYTTTEDPLFAATDDEIIAQFLDYLDGMYPEFDRGQVLAGRVSRVANVFAVPTLGYSGTMPSLTTSVPGLITAGSANLPFATLNVNDVLGLVDEIVALAEAPL